MAVKHLTDKEIQEYLDNPSLNRMEETEQHIGFCSLCKERVDTYKLVYKNLQQQPDFSIDDSVCENIIRNVSFSSKKYVFSLYEKAAIAFMVLAGIILTMVITNFSPVFIVKFTGNLFSSLHLFIKPAVDFLIQNSRKFSFILFSAASLITLSMLDLLIRKKFKPMHRLAG
ncbi:hypothetical protein DRQ07_06875 [candidate division KSB1 bacterium]|nr:MAG: hypothetical protein DRQ07_06875 [candidate division KSB1 bacterium]